MASSGMPLSRRAFCALAPVLLAGCATPRARAEVVLVSQPTAVDASKVGLGFYSSSHARPTRNYKRGDDFTLATDAELSRVRWWGQSEGRLFDDLRKDGVTIVIVTHNPKVAERADHTLWLKDGQVEKLVDNRAAAASSHGGHP